MFEKLHDTKTESERLLNHRLVITSRSNFNTILVLFFIKFFFTEIICMSKQNFCIYRNLYSFIVVDVD